MAELLVKVAITGVSQAATETHNDKPVWLHAESVTITTPLRHCSASV